MSENIKIDPYGFREYDARWLYEENINKVLYFVIFTKTTICCMRYVLIYYINSKSTEHL